MLGKYRDFLKVRDYNRTKYRAHAANEAVLKATDAIYAATTEGEVKQCVEDWSRARDALPDLHQRFFEDERAATEAPTGRRPIAALREQAVSNTLRENGAIQDPTIRIMMTMMAFHYAPPKSSQRDVALSQILNNLDELPEADQRMKAARFVVHYSNSHSKLRREAVAKIAGLREPAPKPLEAVWRFWQTHAPASHSINL